MVIARALVDALREAGHEAALVVTPQNRFGRQASAYLANWMTDVGMTHDGHRVDQVISFRYPSYAVRHPAHVCWLNHRMREYYDLWPRFSSSLSWRNRLKERARRLVFHAVDKYLLTHNVTTPVRAVPDHPATPRTVRRNPIRGPVSASASAGVSLRRIRRRTAGGVAFDATETDGPARAGARRARVGRRPVRHRGRRRGRGRGSRRSSRSWVSAIASACWER